MCIYRHMIVGQITCFFAGVISWIAFTMDWSSWIAMLPSCLLNMCWFYTTLFIPIILSTMEWTSLIVVISSSLIHRVLPQCNSLCSINCLFNGIKWFNHFHIYPHVFDVQILLKSVIPFSIHMDIWNICVIIVLVSYNFIAFRVAINQVVFD